MSRLPRAGRACLAGALLVAMLTACQSTQMVTAAGGIDAQYKPLSTPHRKEHLHRLRRAEHPERHDDEQAQWHVS